MISNIVLNPSVDKTCIVEDFEIGQSNNIIDQTMNVGGEGIDVARTIKILQSEPMVLGFLGGLNGRYIKSSLDKSKIRSNFIWVNGDTKLNTLLIDSINGTKTYLYEDYLNILEKHQIRFKQEIKNYIKDSSVLILDGIVPGDLSYDFYKDTIELAKQFNTKTIISTKGETLRKAFPLQPYAIKIKSDNLKDLNLKTETIDETISELYKLLIEHKIHYIAVDMGLQGAYLLSKNKICKGDPEINIEPNKEGNYSSALLAAFSVGIERKYELEKILKLMVAASYSVMTNDENDIICKKSNVDYYSKKVKIKEIMNNRKGWV